MINIYQEVLTNVPRKKNIIIISKIKSEKKNKNKKKL